MVRDGRDDVPVLLGTTQDGLAGIDLVQGRVLTFEPQDVGAVFDADPAAVYYGVQLAWASAGVERVAAEDCGCSHAKAGASGQEYHGSWECLPVGTIIRPQHHLRGPASVLLEKYRPRGVLSRNEAIFMTRTKAGVLIAGGGSDYVYRVEPIGQVYGPFDGGWFTHMLDAALRGEARGSRGRIRSGSLIDPESWWNSPEAKKMADAYWNGAPCPRKGECQGTWEYLARQARVVAVVSPKDQDVAACHGKHKKNVPKELREQDFGEAAHHLPAFPQRLELGRKFEPILTKDPLSLPITGFDEVRAQLLKHRSQVPSQTTITLSTVFAGLTVGTTIATAERGFECVTNLFQARGHAMPSLDEVRDCLWPLGYHQMREKLYTEVPKWAPVVQDAIKGGMRDRELRKHLFLHSELPHGISLAKLSFVLALLGQNVVCLDVRILDRMFGPGKGRDYTGSWDTVGELSLKRYEQVEDAFLRGNPFYRAADPIGRSRAQWMSWESAGKPARVETHHVWMDVVRG